MHGENEHGETSEKRTEYFVEIQKCIASTFSHLSWCGLDCNASVKLFKTFMLFYTNIQSSWNIFLEWMEIEEFKS